MRFHLEQRRDTTNNIYDTQDWARQSCMRRPVLIAAPRSSYHSTRITNHFPSTVGAFRPIMGSYWLPQIKPSHINSFGTSCFSSNDISLSSLSLLWESFHWILVSGGWWYWKSIKIWITRQANFPVDKLAAGEEFTCFFFSSNWIRFGPDPVHPDSVFSLRHLPSDKIYPVARFAGVCYDICHFITEREAIG